MIEWKEEKLIEAGYEIKNARITNADLDMRDNGCMTLSLVVEGAGWGCVYGGRVIGKGYVGADPEFFKATGDGMIYIMRIMDTLECERFSDIKGKYVRVAIKNFFDSVNIIGNIVKDKWFDGESFFQKKVEINETSWHDIPAEEMSMDQLRAAVKDLRMMVHELRKGTDK